MDPLTPLRQSEGCDIGQGTDYIRAAVGPGLADEVQKCYRAFVNECLQRQCSRALVIGRSGLDAFYHLALRDVLRSMAVAGLPPGFRVALVAEAPGLIAVYDTAVVEAARCGIEARRFLTEEEAGRWLASAGASP